MDNQTISDVAMIARNAIDKMIELEKLIVLAHDSAVLNSKVILKPWKGLTDEEIVALRHDTDWSFIQFARRIESKLKEKNHG